MRGLRQSKSRSSLVKEVAKGQQIRLVQSAKTAEVAALSAISNAGNDNEKQATMGALCAHAECIDAHVGSAIIPETRVGIQSNDWTLEMNAAFFDVSTFFGWYL